MLTNLFMLQTGVVAEEESVLLKELGPKPVLVIVAERPALAVFRSRRILRDDIERQLDDRGQSLTGVLFYVSSRVLLLQGLDLPRQRFDLCQESTHPAQRWANCWRSSRSR